ncbi:hypothetical protein HNR46_002757 [Haloferula luteola]|uniref:Uncharacterized protein n=1 Tax=Haloferula luteola TaxID=595692 RepID=A0A840VII2_9BACT|nr:hypothetical protein [Haloferula luteola]MBB5352511.1 hypothetical protein [Haloferula luteola]
MSARPRIGNLSGESRGVSYGVIFGVWAEVLIFCQLHDLYLAPIAPEHFTEYHPPLWGIENWRLLAAAWAFRASIGPGIPLGILALFLGRTGSRPPVPVKTILLGVWPALALTELAGLIAGAWSWFFKKPVYPEFLYPELTRELMTTQSIQLTCYLAGTLAGIGYLLWLKRRRDLLSRP